MAFLLFLILFIAVIWIYCSALHKQKKNFLAVKPKDTVRFTRITPVGNEIGNVLRTDQEHRVHFIAANDKKEVSFPESGLSDKRFYIVNISFSANITEIAHTKGHAGSALAGGVGAVIGASRKKNSRIERTEHKTPAYVTLVDTNLKNTYTIQIMMDTAKFNELNNLYVLNNIELKNIQNELGSIEDDAKNVDNSNEPIEKRLERLKSLLDKELITKQDYENKKKQILGI